MSSSFQQQDRSDHQGAEIKTGKLTHVAKVSEHRRQQQRPCKTRLIAYSAMFGVTMCVLTAVSVTFVLFITPSSGVDDTEGNFNTTQTHFTSNNKTSLNASGTLPTPEARIGLGPEARNYVAYIPVPLNDDEDEESDEDDEYYDDEDYEDEEYYDDDDYDEDEEEYYDDYEDPPVSKTRTRRRKLGGRRSSRPRGRRRRPTTIRRKTVVVEKEPERVPYLVPLMMVPENQINGMPDNRGRQRGGNKLANPNRLVPTRPFNRNNGVQLVQKRPILKRRINTLPLVTRAKRPYVKPPFRERPVTPTRRVDQKPALYKWPGPPYPGPPPRAPHLPLDNTKIHPSDLHEVWTNITNTEETTTTTTTAVPPQQQAPTIIVVQQPAFQVPPYLQGLIPDQSKTTTTTTTAPSTTKKNRGRKKKRPVQLFGYEQLPANVLFDGILPMENKKGPSENDQVSLPDSTSQFNSRLGVLATAGGGGERNGKVTAGRALGIVGNKPHLRGGHQPLRRNRVAHPAAVANHNHGRGRNHGGHPRNIRNKMRGSGSLRSGGFDHSVPAPPSVVSEYYGNTNSLDLNRNKPFPGPSTGYKPDNFRRFDPPNLYTQGFPGDPPSTYQDRANEGNPRRHQTIPDHAVFMSPPPSVTKSYKGSSGGSSYIGKVLGHDKDTRSKTHFRPPVGNSDSSADTSFVDHRRQTSVGHRTPTDQRSMFDTHNRLQPIILNEDHQRRKGDSRQPFKANQAIDPNDYRFYSFVPDPTTTVRPVDRYEQSYRPQPPPPQQQQPLPSPPRRVSSVDSVRHESPDRKFDYYDDDEDYDYIDHYNINYGDQGIELPPSDNGGFDDDEDPNDFRDRRQEVGQRRPPAPPPFPNTFTFYNDDLSSYSVYDSPSPDPQDYLYPTTTSRPRLSDYPYVNTPYKLTTFRPTPATLPPPPTSTPRPPRRYHNTQQETKSDNRRLYGTNGGGGQGSGTQTPLTIGLDVYPLLEQLGGGSRRASQDENRHEVLLKLNLFSKKPNSRGRPGQPEHGDHSFKVGPFSYNAHGREQTPQSGHNEDGYSRSSVEDNFDVRPMSGKDNYRRTGPPPANRRSSSTTPFLPTRVSAVAKKKAVAGETSAKDLRELKKTLFGQLSPLDVLENLVKSHNLKEHPTIHQVKEGNSGQREPETWNSQQDYVQVPAAGGSGVGGNRRNSGGHLDYPGSFKTEGSVRRYSPPPSGGVSRQEPPDSRHALMSRRRHDSSDALRPATKQRRRLSGQGNVFREMQEHRKKQGERRLSSHRRPPPADSNYRHSPHSVAQKNPVRKDKDEDFEYVYYYYYDYVYPEDVASFEDYEDLPQPMKATGGNSTSTTTTSTTTVAPTTLLSN